MELADVVQATLPANAHAPTLLAALVRAVLDRTDGVPNPEVLAGSVLDQVHEPLIQIIARQEAVPPALIAVRLTIERRLRRFTIDLPDTWRHSEQLPDLATHQAEDVAAQPDQGATVPDLGVGLLLMRRLTDKVEYAPQPGDNRWTLTKALSSAPLPAGASLDCLTVALTLPATYRYLNVVTACIEVMVGQYLPTADSKSVYELQLAAQETLINIVGHAYRSNGAGEDGPGQIDVTLTLDLAQRHFVVATRDQGLATIDLARIPDTLEAPQPRSSLLSSSALLFASATLVNVGNYLFNLLLGRWLGPAAFADLSLIVTLFLVMSFITAGLQMPTARFAAIFAADRDLSGIADLRRWLLRVAGWLGVGLLAVFVLGAPLWTSFFSTTSVAPFVIFGLFLPFYLLQGVDRGVLQGRTRFRWLAVTYQTEMWSRLVLSLVLVAMGWAVNGAVVGIGLSFVAAWVVARRVAVDLPAGRSLVPQVRREVLVFVGPVLFAQLGQILINNSDILIVRHFFPAEAAGYYAALALTGRIVFFATWSVVTAMFPIVAQRHRRGEAHRSLLYASLGVVLLGSLLIVAVTYLFPDLIVGLLFGPAYLSIAPLLWLYALATMFYALANVVINYRLSIGNTGGTYLAVGAGIAQVGLLWVFHATLSQVVWVQLLLMAALLVVLLAWDLALTLRDKSRQAVGAS